MPQAIQRIRNFLRRHTVAAGIPIALVVVVAWGFLGEAYDVRAVDVRLACDGLRGESVRVLVFSDVDFLGIGKRERALRGIAERYNPDVLLVAGDVLNRLDPAEAGARLADAASFLDSIPASVGKFFVPGEGESDSVEVLRNAWEGVIDVLSNDRRLIDVHGERIDLYGIHPRRDRVPWPLGVERGRAFTFSRSRSDMAQRLVYVGDAPESWRNIEITLAFESLEYNSYLDFRFAWTEGDDPEAGDGWRVTRHEWRTDFRTYLKPEQTKRLGGRPSSGYVPEPGVWHRARIRLEDDGAKGHLRVRFWREGEPEPDHWQIDASDSQPDRHPSGTIALGSRRGVRRYADLEVRDLDGHLLLREDFSDPEGFRRRWKSGSRLEDWLYDEAETDAARILLTHEPDAAIDVADADGRRPCLVLAGHTHGGQVRIPGIGALYTATKLGRKYDRGLFDYRGVRLYITAGVGTSMVPIRLFNPPEVTLLTLVPPGSGSPETPPSP